MARGRELQTLKPGEYQATVFWSCGSGIEQRDRYAEQVRVKVTDKWAYIYPRDGEEIVKLSRTRNHSAQVYVGMTLREAIREKVSNSVMHGPRCSCNRSPYDDGDEYRVGENQYVDGSGELRPCIHTADWYESEIDERISRLPSDEQWPSILAQRRIDAVAAQAKLEAQERERIAARESGYGEWYQRDGQWLVKISGYSVGDAVTVRRRNGSTSRHILTVEIARDRYAVGQALPDLPATHTPIYVN